MEREDEDLGPQGQRGEENGGTSRRTGTSPVSDVLIRWEETTLCAAPCALPGTKGAGKDGGSDEPLHDIGGCWRLAGRGCGDRVDVFCLSREIGITELGVSLDAGHGGVGRGARTDVAICGLGVVPYVPRVLVQALDDPLVRRTDEAVGRPIRAGLELIGEAGGGARGRRGRVRTVGGVRGRERRGRDGVVG